MQAAVARLREFEARRRLRIDVATACVRGGAALGTPSASASWLLRAFAKEA